jgi:hypothetical protein
MQYHVFYPRAGSVLDDANVNIHLTTCGRGTYNADDDEIIVPDACDPSNSDCSRQVVGRRLLRSKHNW